MNPLASTMTLVPLAAPIVLLLLGHGSAVAEMKPGPGLTYGFPVRLQEYWKNGRFHLALFNFDDRDLALLFTYYGEGKPRDPKNALARIPLKAHGVVHVETNTLGKYRHLDASLEDGRYLGHVVLSEKSPGEELSGIITVTSLNLHWDLPFVFQQPKLTYRSGETIAVRVRVPGASRGIMTIARRLRKPEHEPELPRLTPLEVECDSLPVSVTDEAFSIAFNSPPRKTQHHEIRLYLAAPEVGIATMFWLHLRFQLHYPDGRCVGWGTGRGIVVEPRCPAPKLSTDDLQRAWIALADEDAPTRYVSVWRLAKAGEPAVTFLRTRVCPVPPVPQTRLRQLVEALDSARFQERQRASRELAGLGEAAVPHLLVVLKTAPSAEVRRRIGQLVARHEGTPLPASALRALRAVEILKKADSPGATGFLRELAAGAPGARLTEEARQALRSCVGYYR
jgi:hypothetical protein